jgi:hypothetical protein
MKNLNLRLLTSLFFCFAINFAKAESVSPTERNDKLLGFNEAYEVLTEKALTDDVNSIKSAWKDAKGQQKDIDATLDAAGAKKYDDLLAIASQANKQKKWVDLSLASAEIYKFIVLACDASVLDVPASVHILDYVGFKNKAYLKMATVDWSLISQSVTEGQNEWSKIKDQVTDKGLSKSMCDAIDGIAKATKEKDSALLTSANETMLNLVDELETNLSKKNNTSTGPVKELVVGKIYTSAETSSLMSLTKETSAALAAQDKKLMVMKLTDLESAWDDAADKLTPRNPAQWKAIDDTLDRAINSLRSTSYDEAKGKEALDQLSKLLIESTK